MFGFPADLNASGKAIKTHDISPIRNIWKIIIDEFHFEENNMGKAKGDKKYPKTIIGNTIILRIFTNLDSLSGSVSGSCSYTLER